MRNSVGRSAIAILCATTLTLLLMPAARASVTGPVIGGDFPDPSVLQVGSTWYAYATNGNGKNVQLATAGDVHGSWTRSGTDPLPNLGSWASGGLTWAPDVINRGDGHFVLYYTAHGVAANTQCVGAAVAASPVGPFQPQSGPVVCAASEGGAIDPNGFTDSDGSRWIVYKIDGNSLGGGGSCGNGNGAYHTPIRLQRMSSDGLSPIGSPVTILDRGPYDGPLIEAPVLIKHNGTYVLFFSSNCFNTDYYDISTATAASITGPYTKASAPLLVTNASRGLYGPGSCDVTPDGRYMLFHARTSSGFNPLIRSTYEADLTWSGAVPTA
jgi:beta-xylosidase